MNYSKELFYSLKDQHGYIGLIYAVFGVFLFATPLNVFLVTKILPKEVTGTFRFLLTSCFISSTSLVVIRALWIPIPTVPVMGVYSAGIIRHLGPTANLICLNFYWACLVNMQICGTFCLVFQFSALQPFSWISSFGNRPGRVKLCYGTYLIGMVTILSIFIHLSVVDRSVFYHYAVQTNNQYIIELINNEPTWIGFSSAIKPTVIAFGIFVTVPDLCVASLAIFLTIKIWFIIEADKSRVTPLTLSIERNLYHTFLFRTANMVTFYTIPYFGIAASIFFEIQIPQLGIFFHSIICFHILIHGIGSILMIRPLRVYIFNKCLRKKILSLPSNHSSGSNTLPTTFTARSEKISLRI